MKIIVTDKLESIYSTTEVNNNTKGTKFRQQTALPLGKCHWMAYPPTWICIYIITYQLKIT